MDPNANTRERIALLTKYLDGTISSDEYDRLQELQTAYTEWITGGGFLADRELRDEFRALAIRLPGGNVLSPAVT